MKQMALAHINDHASNKVAIYTDGSRNEDGRIGGAFYSKQLMIHQKFRLPNHNSILTAELVAISRAIAAMKNRHDVKEFVIFTNSIAAAQVIEAGASNSQPHLVGEVLDDVMELASNGRKCEVHWLPSHIDIEGNDEADRLATASLHHLTIDVDIKPEIRDSYHTIEQKTLELWQTRWNSATVGRHLYNIQPETNRRIKFVDRTNRAKETLLTRLRLGRCGLKHYLHQMRIGDDGKCTRCQVDETVQHWLMECPGNVHLQQQLTQRHRPAEGNRSTTTFEQS